MMAAWYFFFCTTVEEERGRERAAAIDTRTQSAKREGEEGEGGGWIGGRNERVTVVEE